MRFKRLAQSITCCLGLFSQTGFTPAAAHSPEAESKLKHYLSGEHGPVKSAVRQGIELYRKGGLDQLKTGCEVALGLTEYWRKQGSRLKERDSWIGFMAIYTYGNLTFKRVGSNDATQAEFFGDPKYTQVMSGMNRIASAEEIAFIVKTAVAETQQREPRTTYQSAPTQTPNELALAPRHGVRGIQALVPEGWRQSDLDGQGSGASTEWTDPANPERKLTVSVGMAMGGWYEADGVKGSINPRNMVPQGVSLLKLRKGFYVYQVRHPASGLVTDGAWKALLNANGVPEGYRQAALTLAPSEHQAASRILNSAMK